MFIQNLQLLNFRNFKNKIFEFSPEITALVGENAVGKTNTLEAIYILSAGKSFKAKPEEEVINFESETARINGVFGNIDEKINLSAFFSKPLAPYPKKRLMFDSVPKRSIDFVGIAKAALFTPSDLDLLTDAPSVRRKFLDHILSISDREYRSSLLSYEKAIRQRNKLLIRIREEGIPRSHLMFWDKLLIKNGNFITDKRKELIDFINKTDQISNLIISVDYDKSEISEARLDQYKREEVSAGMTLVGPHRDDFVVLGNNKNVSHFGSRGEARLAVLWLKIAELEFVGSGGIRPILLLDDIFSELDHKHRHVVFAVAQKQQTIITSADPHTLQEFAQIKKIEL